VLAAQPKIVFALACVLLFGPTAASQSPQTTPSSEVGAAGRLCLSSGYSETATSSALENLAAQTEAQLRLGSIGSFQAVAAEFDRLAVVVGEVSSQRTRAAVCTAYGEVARQLPGGGAGSAQPILFAALRAAEGSGDSQSSARAAYRLALTSLSVGGSDSRSAEAIDTYAYAPIPSESADNLCITSRLDPGSNGRPNPLLALVCAQARADMAGDTSTAGLATLRWARLTLNSAETSTLGAGRLERMLVEIKRRLEQAEFVDNETQVSLRLMETWLDAAEALAVRREIDIQSLREPIVDQAVERIVRGSDDFRTLSLGHAIRARLALVDLKPELAITNLRKAIGFESRLDTPSRIPEWYLLLSRADPSNRQSHVSSAYRALQSIRPVIPLRDDLTEESNLSLRMRRTFLEEVSVRLALLPATGGGDVEGVQKIVEAYREAEIASVLGDDCVPPTPTPIQPADLRRNEIIFYPISLGDRLELMYADGVNRSYRRVVVPNVRASDVAALSRDLQSLVAGTTDGEEWKVPARKLYDILIKPVEKEFFPEGGEKPVLIIIPDGALRGAPLAALLDSSGKPLISKARIAIAPSLSFTPIAEAGEQRRRGDARVLAASLSQRMELSAGVFDELKATSAEGDRAWEFARGAKYNVRLRDFTSEQLQAQIESGKFDILHLATHAAFNGRSEQSFIVANGSTITLTDLRGWISRNRAKGNDLDLLVLSACETAVGDDSANMGLAGAAIQAGAISVIASLWQVNDISSADLMGAFYKAYASADASKVEALRQAQESMYLAGGRYAHPHHWAAYTLIGGWR
jgi:CHAT domain-containing protein